MRAEVAAFVKAQGQITSSTEYEDEVLSLSRKFAAGLVAHSSDKARKSRNAKKKVLTSFGHVELDKRHILAGGTTSFAVSEKLRALCCLVGQAKVYDQASELFEEIGQICNSRTQIQRICIHYGSLLDPLIAADCEAVIPRLERTSDQDPLYIMVDGAMLFTRPDEWREIKLGRIFHHSSTVELSPKRRQTLKSVYVSHLGSVNDFFPKLERHLTNYRRRVIIGDGAQWI